MPAILYVGDAWSASWSICGWLACRLANLEVEVKSIFLYRPETKGEIKAVSPSGKLPVLLDGETVIWDSMAIAEYLWELNPQGHIWPHDFAARCHARCIAAEVHREFEEVRVAMPMNLVKRWPIRNGLPSIDTRMNGPGVKGGHQGVRQGLLRMEEIWRDCRERYGAGGPYLFGAQYNFVDALFAPMVSRFVTYDVKAANDVAPYIDANIDYPPMQEWMARAESDAEVVGREVAMAFP
ncbi:glutathione S-transferase N-terminal domain-containing protein [Roseovarius sp.]|uniref:glutathione S-transferase N-terminal domain-containing protein n=1 Tax=Roseovarius sp. TaxID=1486281 RepID=UPI0035615F2E